MRRRSVWLVVLGILVACLVVIVVQHGRAASRGSQQAADGRAPGGGPGGGGGPVPVVAGTAERKDVPVYLEGVGTVQAYQTVTVRARVDGQLERVAFQEGQDVKPGDLLAVIDPRPFQAALDQALAKKGQDEANLANSRRDLERYKVLVQQNLIQRQMLDAQEAAVAQQEAATRGDQAAIDNARVQLAYTHITAPIPGRTGLRLVDPGNIVHAADPNGIVVLTQLNPIAVVFTVPEQHVDAINAQQGQRHLPVDAVASDGQTVLDHGELLLVDNQIDVSTGTVRLKAIFPNANRRLWPGQFVNARLLLQIRPGSTVVAAPAVQRGPQGTFVYAIKPDNTVEMRPVKVAQIRAGEALIDEGVSVGERVVVDGQYKLQPGARVTLQAAPGAAARATGEQASEERPSDGGRRGGERRGGKPPQGREPPAEGHP